MIRIITSTDSNILTLEIPDKYIGKELEVIAFSSEEVVLAPPVKKNNSGKSFKFDEATLLSERSLSEDWLSEKDKRWDKSL